MTHWVKKKINLNGDMDYRVIDTTEALAEVAKALCRRKTVAVDLESDSMHHYKEKVCLIQLATEQASLVIDTLRIEDISPLEPFFSNPEIQKIFHGADYDVRSLYRDYHISVRNLFDTELASRFLGVRESGLDAVLRRRFSIRLDKKFQKKDWSRRPLPNEMIEYAATDAQYLIPLARQLQKELEKNERRAWVDEECQLLSRVRPVSFDGMPFYLKFKGAGRLEPRSLAVLEALLTLRDEIAEKKDRPWFKILRNESLKKIAVLKTTDLESMEKDKILSRRQISMYGDALIAAIEGAFSIPEDRLPRYPHKQTMVLKPVVRKRIRALKVWRDAKAHSLQLDPAIVCNKALIAAVAQNNPKTEAALYRIKEMKNWQRRVFGKEIFAVLHR